MKYTRAAVALTAAVLVVTACGGGGGTAAPTGGASEAPSQGGGETTTIKIGLTFPLSGSALASAGPARDGALLAIKEANAAGAIPGVTLEGFVLDHAVNGVHDPQQGSKDMTQFVQTEDVMAVVGPFNSSIAAVQIPISNEAKLLQCSPANTNPDLTKGDAGRQLRAANPDIINYVRVATTDDIQGPAVAQFGYNELGLKTVAIIDDTEVYGKGIADAFEAEWEKLGGTVVGREGAPKGTTDYVPILTNFAAQNPDAVFYGGVTATGGGLVRKQMPQAGLGDIPYLGGDGIQDGSGTTDGSFITIAGDAAADSYSSVAAIAEIPDAEAFAAKYKAEYNVDPGAYSASGYACVQIIIEGLKSIAGGEITRDALRGAVVDGGPYETVLGTVSFDEVGDTSQKIISLYKVDLTLPDGGNWAFEKQVDYGAGG